VTRESLGVAFREGSAKAGQFVASRPDWLIERFAKVPTTNIRVFVTLYLALRTAGHYFATPGWEPSLEWLGFIAALAGIDVTQWVRKRTTDHEYQRIQRGLPTNGEGTLPDPYESASLDGRARAEDA